MVADAAHAPAQQAKAKIFISYSRKDMAFADRLDGSLKTHGFEPLIDRSEIYAFEDWWERIRNLITGADTIVFVISPDAVASEICAKEVDYAASLNKRFAPIVCRRVEDSSVPEPLRRLNFIFFDDPAQFEASVDKLGEALQTDIGWIRRHTEFGEAARRWVEGGRAGGLLLRSPVLDQAEAWTAFRPSGAPPATADTEAFIAASRKAEMAARRRSRILNAALYTMLVGIILGLIGWINQDYIKEQLTWYLKMRPYMISNVRPFVLSTAAEKALSPPGTFRECAKDCPEMIVVPAGQFEMGSPPSENGRFENEGPPHEVTIARAFAISKFDVTFDDWDTCVSVGGCARTDDQGFGRERRPVINVSWNDAQAYVSWLSKMTGKQYRLPTEAEWEYVARAGTTTAFYWGDENSESGVYCNGCGSEWDLKKTSPVGSFKPNAFGLYDIVGNVWQWVQDCYHDNYKGAPTDGSAWTSDECGRRVARGGAFNRGPIPIRLAARLGRAATARIGNGGLRVVRTFDAYVDAWAPPDKR
jgi:formylglycine-generating enzyme required for sulfatase activity